MDQIRSETVPHNLYRQQLFQSISVSNVTGYLQSEDSSVCSIATGRLFLLYSRQLSRTVGMEILVNSTGNYEGEFMTKLNDGLIGLSCDEEGGKSALTTQSITISSIFKLSNEFSVFESTLKLTWTNFASLSLVGRAMTNVIKRKSTRIQIGFVYGSDG